MRPEELMRGLEQSPPTARAGLMADSSLKAAMQGSELTQEAQNGRLSKEEKEFIDNLIKCLPPIIARKAVPKFLGGLLSQQTLAMADSAGVGPEVAYKIGRNVAYRTDSLVRWIVGRFGVKRLINIKKLL